MSNNSPRNIAYIDGQNLYMGTAHADNPWKIDCRRFRRYLYEKYNVTEAYYFIGTRDEHLSELYDMLTTAGFLLVFRPHDENSHSSKKGNVDTDIVYFMLHDYIEGKLNNFNVILVSGDGDYFRTVKYLIEKGKFNRILLPNEQRSSNLYKTLDALYVAALSNPSAIAKIQRR